MALSTKIHVSTLITQLISTRPKRSWIKSSPDQSMKNTLLYKLHRSLKSEVRSSGGRPYSGYSTNTFPPSSLGQKASRSSTELITDVDAFWACFRASPTDHRKVSMCCPLRSKKMAWFQHQKEVACLPTRYNRLLLGGENGNIYLPP